METTKKRKLSKKVGIGLAVLIVVIGIMAGLFMMFRPKTMEGSKKVTIEVVSIEDAKKLYEIKTDAEYLRQAMEETKGLTFSGTESEFGMMVDTVNNVRADYGKDGAYWAFYVNGEYCQYSIDTQPVLDGDKFIIAYTLSE